MDKTPQILNPGEKLKYRISAKGVAIFAMVLTLFLLPIWFFAYSNNLLHTIIPWGSLGIFIIMVPSMWFITTLEIDNEGMRLYLVNVMKWDEVVSAKKINLLELKYLRVTRQKGMNWMVPLYLNGSLPIEVALERKSPAGNPIHQLFASDSQNR